MSPTVSEALVFYEWMVRASGSGLAYDDCDETSSQGTVNCCCSDVVLQMLSKTLAWHPVLPSSLV